MSEKLGTIKATASNSTSTTPTASVSSKMLATSKASAEPPASSGKSEKPGTIKATASASTSTSFASSSLRWSNSTITKATQTTVKPVSLTTSEPASVSTSTVYSVSVYTVTKCPLTVTGCSTGQVTTETFFSTASPAVETAQPPKPTPSKAPVLTTKTVYTTTTYIVTACPNAVPGCNVGDATTEVIRYTTVCPVGETETAEPAPTKAPVLTTKTVYTTTTYIVTACPNAVPGCNVGDATTEVIRYTTVCPVGETETAKVPQPTGPAPEVPDIDTKPPIKTVKLHSTSALEPSVRSKAVTSRPTGATETPKPGCAGADCSGIALPTNSWTKEPGSGCVGPKCSGVAIPSNGVAGSRSRPSSVPSPIMTAGASTVALSLAGLVAVVAAQILAI
ncbi:chitinase 18-18 [Metarhizium rileyi]|uniref:Chitinase 18-18 n=1 Tax=Metarhizium rileyi (strain RCEF 4871) TaxID=1649241 RepID=A0A167GSX4_METRR|nr:chitinase 18-18 [Metarhizium rileyi RCEF 4871]